MEDTGLGIKKEDLVDLFEIFTMTNNYLEAKERGTGVGLYICKKLAA